MCEHFFHNFNNIWRHIKTIFKYRGGAFASGSQTPCLHIPNVFVLLVILSYWRVYIFSTNIILIGKKTRCIQPWFAQTPYARLSAHFVRAGWQQRAMGFLPWLNQTGQDPPADSCGRPCMHCLLSFPSSTRRKSSHHAAPIHPMQMRGSAVQVVRTQL